MNYIYPFERNRILETLSTVSWCLEHEIVRERERHGHTPQYRSLCKTYIDISKRYMTLLQEIEAEKAAGKAANGNALAAFNSAK